MSHGRSYQKSFSSSSGRCMVGAYAGISCQRPSSPARLRDRQSTRPEACQVHGMHRCATPCASRSWRQDKPASIPETVVRRALVHKYIAAAEVNCARAWQTVARSNSQIQQPRHVVIHEDPHLQASTQLQTATLAKGFD